MVSDREDFELLLNDFGIQFKVHSFSVLDDGYVSTVQTEFFPSPKNSTFSSKCDMWIENFSNKTNTNWIVKSTENNHTRKEYSKSFMCQHSSKNKTKNPTYKKKEKSRDKSCTAKIKISVKKVTRDTMKKDTLLKLGMVVVIKIHFRHSHLVEVAEAYGFLRVSNATRMLFLSYFDDGMSSAAAKSYHEINIFTSEDDPYQKAKILANSQLNPTIRQVQHIHETWRKGNYGTRELKTVYEVIKSKVEILEGKGTKIVVTEDPFIIVILTPIMQRCHGQRFASEIVFVDSSGSCDQANTCVTFLFGASKIGGLPLGCVLHTAQTEENYKAAFSSFRTAVDGIGFFGKLEPSVFMTDDSKAERTALHATFPSSKLLLCTFHVTQAVWRWLWDSKNQIFQDDRKYLMNQFRKILFSKKEVECLKFYQDFVNDAVVNKYESFKSHIEKFWQRRKEWALCYRGELITRGHNTNNFVEASIRIFKDIVLQRCRAFNAAALLDFVTETLESYHSRRLLEYASKKARRQNHLYGKLVKKSKNLRVTKVNDIKFHVLSSRHHYVYKVDADKCLCNCVAGQGGAFCKHLCAVHEKFGVCSSCVPHLDCSDYILLARLAIGKDANVNFYRGMDQKETVVQDDFGMVDAIENPTQESNRVELGTEKISGFTTQLERLRNNNQKIETLIAKNFSSDLEKLLIKLNNKLDTLTTPSQIQAYLAQQCKWTSSKYIPVQPASQGRRKKRVGLHCGLKRLQAGRPSNVELGKVVQKKKRDLAKNIYLNCPNAKSH